DAPTTVQGWATLIDALNSGERVTARAENGGKVIVTRSKVKVRATDRRGPEVIYWEARNAEGLALKLA
nr:hypothetical protein [Gemmatimonadaceae bacterium]